jgi:hypothetical protein
VRRRLTAPAPGQSSGIQVYYCKFVFPVHNRSLATYTYAYLYIHIHVHRDTHAPCPSCRLIQHPLALLLIIIGGFCVCVVCVYVPFSSTRSVYVMCVCVMCVCMYLVFEFVPLISLCSVYQSQMRL